MERTPKNLVPYEDFRSLVRDGDLLLWHPVSLAGKAICLGSSIKHRTWVRYSHASMAAFAKNGRLYSLEMVQWRGGRHQPLSRDVGKYPGSCELWKPVSQDYDGLGAVHQMMWLLGQSYGWMDFLHIFLRGVFPHVLLPKWPNSDDPDQPLVCSSSFHWAARTGGRVTCCYKPDAEVSPADLSLSPAFRYIATPVL